MSTPTQPNRRALLRGVSWTAPAAAVVIATPALASSPPPATAGGEYGLFVTTGQNGSQLGYNGNDNTGTIRPTSPTAYFSAVKAGNNPESDINWNDASQCRTNSSLFRNGEGSFTPVANSASGVDGSYVTPSGFWWSVPTTAAYTGSGYVAGSTATLETGATFTTEMEVLIPAGTNALYTAENIKINGQTWTKSTSGRRTTINGSSATYLAFQALAGNWSITAPTITTLSDGSVKVTGTITFTTTATRAASTVTQRGTIYYGQTEIMPATIDVYPGYGWTSFSLTSYVQSATITYTGQPAGMASSTTLTNQLLTTSTVYPQAC